MLLDFLCREFPGRWHFDTEEFLLDAGLRRLCDNGVNGCVIDWTGLLDFYGKAGFTPYERPPGPTNPNPACWTSTGRRDLRPITGGQCCKRGWDKGMMGDWVALERVLRDAVPGTAPALVCRVERGGECVYEGAFGWLDPEECTRPAQADTLFDLASVTKLFTTTAFLRLVDGGRVGLDQPLADVLPEFGGVRPIGGAEDPLAKTPLPGDPRRAGETVDARRVTFRHLLTHTSGLPAWRSVYAQCGPPPLLPLADDELDARQRRALAALVAYPFVAQPGESYLYSDIGLMLLGYGVARLSGLGRLDRAIAGLVTEPLGIDAYFCPTAEERPHIAPTERCAWRGRRLAGEVHDENAAGLGGVAGHAGLFASAGDVCRLGRLFLSGGEGLLSPALVAESSREQHASAVGIRRGLGWQLRSDPNPTCSTAFSQASFGHTGFTGTSLWCDPERDLCVALLTNRVYHGRDAAGIIALRPRVHASIGYWVLDIS